MKEILHKYPLDLTGVNPDNLVSKEPHPVESEYESIIILKGGPFYAKSIKIEEKSQRTVFEYEKDYTFNYLHEEATNRSGKPVFGLILLKDKKFKGEVLVTYQTVGGQYANHSAAIEKALEDVLSSEGAKTVKWEDVLNKPIVFPPAPHMHTMDDLTGVDEIVDALEDIAGAITGERPSELNQIIDQMKKMVTNQYHVKRSPLKEDWSLTPDNPLRLKLHGYPSAFSVVLSIWDEFMGASELWLSGELTVSGQWHFRHYNVLHGKTPAVTCYITHEDAISAEILLRTDEVKPLTVILEKVTYHKFIPSNFKAEMLKLEDDFVPPDVNFIVPSYPWEKGIEP